MLNYIVLAHIPNCPVWLYGCMAVWLYDCMTVGHWYGMVGMVW